MPESPQLRTTTLSHPVYRVARLDDPMRFSTIDPADALLPGAGNRFDVPGGGVLYAASSVGSCFGETLSRFRPSATMRSRLADDPEAARFMGVGQVPRDWRLKRVVVTIDVVDALPFLDVEDSVTQEGLSNLLAGELSTLGYEQSLDISDVRGRDRRLSRAIARWAYTAQTDEGEYRFSGIRYVSRLADAWECWAIFDGTSVVEDPQRRQSVASDNPDLLAVAGEWGLHVW